MLTSASCVKTSDENNTVVFLGSLNIEDSLKGLDYHFLVNKQKSKIQFGFPWVGVWNLPVKLHPDYSLKESNRAPDMALIKLQISVDFGPSANQICLPTIGETEKDFANVTAIFMQG